MSDSERPDIDLRVVPGVSVFEDTFVFGREYAHIRVNADALRKDLVLEAVRSGCGESEALAFAAKTRFYVGTYPDYVKDAYKHDPTISKLVDLGITTLRQSINPVGAVWRGDDGSMGCLIDVPRVVRAFGEGSIPGFHFPKDLPDEVRQAGLLQSLGSIWNHEREHLIQFANPAVGAKIDSSLKKGDLRQKIALTALGFGTGLHLAYVVLPIPLEYGSSLLTSSFVFLLGGGTLGMLNQLYHKRLAFYERKAYSRQRTQEFVGKTPFQVTFEK